MGDAHRCGRPDQDPDRVARPASKDACRNVTMGKKTEISWVTSTWSPWWGCVKVSPGCHFCYADTLSKRWGFDIWGPPATTSRRMFSDKHWHQPEVWNRQAMKEQERRSVFPSMCDPFE